MSLFIKSSEQAQRRSNVLKSVWSAETRLTQQIIIYIAYLLEQIVINTATRKRVSTRKKSEWNKLVAKELRQGKTMKEISAIYANRKGVA